MDFLCRPAAASEVNMNEDQSITHYDLLYLCCRYLSRQEAEQRVFSWTGHCVVCRVGSWNVARAVRDHGERDTDDAEVTVA